MLGVLDVSVSYGATRVVAGASLSVAAGSLAALIGPNGAGKSSLLKAIATLVPSTGTVVLAGAGLSVAQRRELIAYMPQDTGAASALTVLEVVLLGRVRSLGMFVPEALVDAALEALAQFGLTSLQGRTLDAVSGGQRQLVYLAQALFRRPQVLLLDEPTAALDLRHQLVVLEAVRTHAARNGTVVIAAMHDLTLAAQFADRMTCLSQGRIVSAGRPEEVLTPDLLRRVYGVDARIAVAATGGVQVTPLRASTEPVPA